MPHTTWVEAQWKDFSGGFYLEKNRFSADGIDRFAPAFGARLPLEQFLWERRQRSFLHQNIKRVPREFEEGRYFESGISFRGWRARAHMMLRKSLF